MRHAKVECLLRFQLSRGAKKEICFFETGLEITTGHPIMHDGQWVLPRDVIKPQLVNCEAVYNIVVDRHHIVLVNEVPLILPGHKFTEGVLKHDYLGSQEVIRDLKQMNGWEDGFINLSGDLGSKRVKSIPLNL